MDLIKAAVLANKKALIKYYANLYSEIYINKPDYNDIAIEKVYRFKDDSIKYKVFIFIASSDGNGSYHVKTLSAYCIITDATEEQAVSEINNISSSVGNESE